MPEVAVRELSLGEAVREALGSAAATIWSNPGAGSAWRTGANGMEEMEGLGRVAMATRQPWSPTMLWRSGRSVGRLGMTSSRSLVPPGTGIRTTCQRNPKAGISAQTELISTRLVNAIP